MIANIGRIVIVIAPPTVGRRAGHRIGSRLYWSYLKLRIYG
jgi:hypothetical protein